MTGRPKLASLDFWQMIAISAAIIAVFYPLEPIEAKIEVVSYLVLVVLLFFVRHVGDAINYARFLRLGLFILFFATYIFASRIFFIPLNDYSANKYLYAYFVFGFFGLIIPWCVYRAGGAKDLVPIFTIVSVFYGAISFFPTVESDNLRYSVIGLSPTLMAKLTLLSSLLLIVHRSRNRLALALAILLFAFGVLATLNTGSRGSLLSLAVACGIYAIYRGGIRNIAKYVVLTIVLAALVYFALQFAPDDIQQRFTLEAVSVEEQSDEGDRLMLWSLALEGVGRFWGQGLGSFSLASFVAAPHNVVLESLYELGAAFSAIFFVYLFYPVLRLKDLFSRRSSYVDFLCIAYLYNLAQALFSGELTLSSALLYLTTSMVWLIKPIASVRPQLRPDSMSSGMETRAVFPHSALARSHEAAIVMRRL